MSNYTKLKTNLKLSIQRLKLLEKKKTELSHKSRKEIADYLAINKPDRARIRVEHIIREDNYVEAMEMLEMFCDLLLARFGLIEKMKELDPGLDESIATVIWSAPRISSDIQEFKIISDIFTHKYGRKYADACKTDALSNVNEKVKKRLGLDAPPKLLVEQYLIEIAKNFNVAYVPDQSVMLKSGQVDEDLINLQERTAEIVNKNNNNNNKNNNNNNNGGSGGFGGEASAIPPKIGFNHQPEMPPSYNVDDSTTSSSKTAPPQNDDAQAPALPHKNNDHSQFNINNSHQPADDSQQAPPLPSKGQHHHAYVNPNAASTATAPPPNALPTNPVQYRGGGGAAAPPPQLPSPQANLFDELGLPSVPQDNDDHFTTINNHHHNNNNNNNNNNNGGSGESQQQQQFGGVPSLDFDDLSKRFENLKSSKK